MTITLDDEPCCAKQGYHRKARHHDNSLVILSKTDSAAGRQENPLGFNAVIAPSSHLIGRRIARRCFGALLSKRFKIRSAPFRPVLSKFQNRDFLGKKYGT